MLLTKLAACGDSTTQASILVQPGPATTIRMTAAPTATNKELNSLIGTMGKDGNFTAKVTSVERLIEVQNPITKKFITPIPGSTFIIVYLEVKNQGTEPGKFQVLRLVDGLRRRFYPAISTTGKEAEAAMAIRIGRQSQIQPGLSGKDFIIYEIPTDAPTTPFMLEFGPDNE